MSPRRLRRRENAIDERLALSDLAARVEQRFEFIFVQMRANLGVAHDRFAESHALRPRRGDELMDDAMRCLLADAARKREHDALRQRIAPRSVQIGVHPVDANLEALEKRGEERERLARGHREFRDGVPFDLPRSAVALVIMDEAFGEQARIGPNDARKRSQMLSGLRIALVRHGDAAEVFARRSLAKLGNLVPLQIVDLVADAVRGRGDEKKQIAPFREYVAARRPGHVWLAQPQPLKKASLYCQSVRSERRQTADAAA